MQSAASITVVSISPDADERDVAADSKITVVFSSPVEVSGEEPIAVTAGEDPMDGTIAVDGSTLTFVPREALGMGVEYKVTLNASAIAGVDGESVKERTWIFVTKDGSWSPVVGVDAGEGRSSTPVAAIGSDGSAVIVWSSSSGGFSSIYSCYRTAGGDWSAPVLVEESTLGDALNPDVAMTSNGTAIAVWQQSNGERNLIRSAQFANGTWTSLGNVNQNDSCTVAPPYDNCDATEPQVAMSSAGSAMVVYPQKTGSYMTRAVYANRFTVGVGWGTETLASVGSFPSAIRISSDGEGNALLSYVERDNANLNWFVAGAGWGQNAQSTEPDWGNAGSTLIAAKQTATGFDADGNAHMVWSATDVRAAFHRKGEGWSAIGTVGGGTAPELAVNRNNLALLVYVPADPAVGPVQSSFFSSETWSDPVAAAPVISGTAQRPQVGIDERGNGIAAWTQTAEGASDIWWNRFANGQWKAAATLDTGGGPADQVQLVVNTSGVAVATWRQDDGSASLIFARVFDR